MVSRVMFDEVLLPVVHPVAPIDRTRPVFARFVHPHLMFLPIRLGLECFEDIQFGAICAEHERVTGLALALLTVEGDG